MTNRSTSRSLPIALLRAREVVMQPIRPMLKDIGLTEQKWRVLRTLDEAGELEQSAIARHASLSLPSLTRILRSLEDEGLVSRTQDPGDKRRTLVQSSDKGSTIVRDNLGMANEVFEDLEREMGADKLAELLDLLGQLQDVRLKR